MRTLEEWALEGFKACFKIKINGLTQLAHFSINKFILNMHLHKNK